MPAFRTGAVYVPDGSGNPYWLPLEPGDGEPSGGPDTGDADQNGVQDWYDRFQEKVNDNTLVWWGGGSGHNGQPFVVDGVAVTFPAQWSTAADTDGDGIPDAIDPYPSDPANNSYWWPGGTVQFEGRNYLVRAQWFAGSAADMNGNEVPDCMEPVLANLSSPGMYYWPGGTFLIDGQYSTFGEWYLYGCDTGDLDGDGIPDAIDPYPNDPWNNTQYYWAGGDWFINGTLTHFDGGYYSGLPSPDSDGDGLPDNFDPYPYDSANNTAWWSGGTFLMNGTWQSFAGCYHAANAGDADWDGIPDDLDPYPNDSNNNSSAWWPGGSYVINGSEVWFPGQWHLANEPDSDNDGIPDSLDPYPNDASNNSFWWGGGNFTVNNCSVWFSGGWYAGAWADSDGDGMPDSVDPYPNDSNNNNSNGGGDPWFYWQGGTFTVNGTSCMWGANYYPGTWSDSDGDGIPDSLDPYPNDANNNNPPTFWWGGGTFMVNSQWQTFYGQVCTGQLDSNGNFPDADHDGIPDSVDPCPLDPLNGTPGFFWPPLDGNGAPTTVTYPMDADNHPVTFTSHLYYTQWQDSDGDGIPDVADPYPNDYYNGNDTDGDGIPDSVEVAYGLNRLDPSDAGTIRYIGGQTDGITWKQAYDHGWMNYLMDATVDSDGDGMSDVYEIANGLDPYNPADAVDATVGHLQPGTTATMNDFILNIEKARAGIPLSHIVTTEVEYGNITGHLYGEGIVHDFTKSVAENDWDGDGVSNYDEVVVFHTDLRSSMTRPTDLDLLNAYLAGLTSLTTNLNFATLFATMDANGDGIPDSVEKQFEFGPADVDNIRYINGQTDNLTWRQAYQQGYLTSLKPEACNCSDKINGNNCTCEDSTQGCMGNGGCVNTPPPPCCTSPYCRCDGNNACQNNANNCPPPPCNGACGGNVCTCTTLYACASNPDACYQPTITTSTVERALGDQFNPSRKLIGVGEEVRCTLSGVPGGTSVAWSVETTPSGSNCIIQPDILDANGGFFTAEDQACNATITAHFADSHGQPATASTTFTIIEPLFEVAEKAGAMNFPAGTQGAGMELKITLQPQTVSFYNVQLKELPGPASNFTGGIKQAIEDPNIPAQASDFAHEGDRINPNWENVTRDNVTYDEAWFAGWPLQFITGSWTWDIPVRWRVVDFPVEHTLPNRVQISDIQNLDGTSQVTKFAPLSETRTP